MSVDTETVRRIAHLARIAVDDDEIEHLGGELNAMLAFVEQLSEVDVEGVEPMTSVMPMVMKKRADVVTEGEDAEAVLANAPAREGDYFVVPKVIEWAIPLKCKLSSVRGSRRKVTGNSQEKREGFSFRKRRNHERAVRCFRHEPI